VVELYVYVYYQIIVVEITQNINVLYLVSYRFNIKLYNLKTNIKLITIMTRIE